MRNSLRLLFLYLAWVIALFALVGSLFGSEILHLPMCTLCWYQRICLYPLALLLGIACFTQDFKVVKYALPLSILGFFIGLYQYLLQMHWLPDFSILAKCTTSGGRCDIMNFQIYFITLPFLSLIASFLISLFLFFVSKKEKSHS